MATNMKKSEIRNQKIENRKWNLKNFVLSSILFLVFSSFAYAVIVPCGGTGQPDCTFSHIPILLKNTMRTAMEMVSLFAVAMIVYTGFKLMTGKNKPAELADSKERMWKVGVGIIMFFGGAGLTLMILRSIGLNEDFLKTFNWFFPTALLDVISAHAYAADSNMLPNPLNLDNPLDFFAMLLNLTIKWFVFPCIILSWLYAGFLYVRAQGNPEEISNAHSWLWWTFIGTGIIMLAEVFYSVLRGTITTIIS